MQLLKLKKKIEINLYYLILGDGDGNNASPREPSLGVVQGIGYKMVPKD